ncbi:hypothetical protein B0A48_02636 [Cryoendolithus antarcticus]|uniref:DUF2293 domain-containing protein n=1 Tax=Cryoendolithus antarcticus TaxID=1507870 RepID=A0A1V8TKV3_9PEZI|nr:hypothetical protein B0A48_02636 [Cryoendolithus antarcticus]
MVASNARASRALSVLSSTNVRDTLKRREKPYKTESKKIIGKKRKLALQTSYDLKAPSGFAFLPVGTPDLAELCKELSRKRELLVNVVNTAGLGGKAKDPSHVSHHVHRIGYHFRADVLEEACEQLKYVPYEGGYIKETDLQHRSSLAAIIAKYGLNARAVSGQNRREDPEMIGSAIRELFPRIPDPDLQSIIEHAWQEGEERVGNAEGMPLARRVQLAVNARIRHTYTDYDILLKSFDWTTARREVEPVCLAKLLEWRGENEAEDEGFEEIVRETIVLDDDDDDVGASATEADETDNNGNASDTSVEIVARPAALHDLRAEDELDRDYRYNARARGPRRAEQHRINIARQKIHEARERRQLPQAQQVSQLRYSYGSSAAQPLVIANNDPPLHAQRPYAGTVTYSAPGQPRIYGREDYMPTHTGRNIPPQPRRLLDPAPQLYDHLLYRGNADRADLRHAPIPSIEMDPGQPQPPTSAATSYHVRDSTPDGGRVMNRQRISSDWQEPQYEPPANGSWKARGAQDLRHEPVDLTTPPRRYAVDGRESGYSQPIPRVLSGGYHGEVVDLLTPPQPRYAAVPEMRVVPEAERHRFRVASPQPARSERFDAPYDPTHPLLDRPPANPRTPVEYERREPPTQYAQVAPPTHVMPGSWPHTPLEPVYAQPPQPYAPPVNSGYQTLRPVQEPQYRRVSSLVHGAPAPVQQMQREAAYRAQGPRPPPPAQYVQVQSDDPRYAPAASAGGAYSAGQYHAG